MHHIAHAITCFTMLMWGATCHAQQLHSSVNPTHNVGWGTTPMHSSVNPTQWIPTRSVQQEGAALKKPVIPYSNNDVTRVAKHEKAVVAKDEKAVVAKEEKAKEVVPSPVPVTTTVETATTEKRTVTKPEPEKKSTGKVYQSGMATYYSAKTHGRMMADGTRYDKTKLFCAHRTLPFGTRLRVVNKKNGREVEVVVHDRGPFVKGRIIDLSNKAAEVIGMLSDGVVAVDIYVVE